MFSFSRSLPFLNGFLAISFFSPKMLQYETTRICVATVFETNNVKNKTQNYSNRVCYSFGCTTSSTFALSLVDYEWKKNLKPF